MELFMKVYIKSEDDLPKEAGDYSVQFKTGYGRILHFQFNGDVGWKIDVHDWIQNIDWYLQPYEFDLPSDEEIEQFAMKTTHGNTVGGAKWIIEEIKKRNNL